MKRTLILLLIAVAAFFGYQHYTSPPIQAALKGITAPYDPAASFAVTGFLIGLIIWTPTFLVLSGNWKSGDLPYRIFNILGFSVMTGILGVAYAIIRNTFHWM